MKRSIFSLILLFCSAVLIFSNITNFNVKAYSVKEEYTAKSLYLMDYNSNSVLYEKTAQQKFQLQV